MVAAGCRPAGGARYRSSSLRRDRSRWRAGAGPAQDAGAGGLNRRRPREFGGDGPADRARAGWYVARSTASSAGPDPLSWFRHRSSTRMSAPLAPLRTRRCTSTSRFRSGPLAIHVPRVLDATYDHHRDSFIPFVRRPGYGWPRRLSSHFSSRSWDHELLNRRLRTCRAIHLTAYLFWRSRSCPASDRQTLAGLGVWVLIALRALSCSRCVADRRGLARRAVLRSGAVT